MKNPITNSRSATFNSVAYNGVDSHKWANKMEVQRLVSSKPKELAKLRKRRTDIL